MKIEHKDLDGNQLSKEAKAALDAIRSGFEELKAKNDVLEAEVKKGRADVVSKTEVEKINEAITNRLDALAEAMRKEESERKGLETRLNKRGLVDQNAAAAEEKAAEINRVSKVYQTDADILSADQYSDYKSALDKFLRRREQKWSEAERKAISVGSDPAGGYFVTPEISDEITSFVYETSALRQVANVRTIGTDALEGIYKLGKAAAAWVGETQTRAETGTPDLAAWRIPVHELYAWPEISLKALEDPALDMEAELRNDVAAEFGRKEETSFFTGTGVGQPRGLLTYAAGTPASTSLSGYQVVRQTNTGANGAFAATNPADILIDVIGQTKRDFLSNARWIVGRTTMAATRKLKDVDGNYLWERSLQASQPFTLLGYPVTLAEDMPNIGTNSLSIAFGDFSRFYTIVDRLGISILVDPYTSSTGFVRYKTRKRVGGAVTNFEAVQLIKFSA